MINKLNFSVIYILKRERHWLGLLFHENHLKYNQWMLFFLSKLSLISWPFYFEVFQIYPFSKKKKIQIQLWQITLSSDILLKKIQNYCKNDIIRVISNLHCKKRSIGCRCWLTVWYKSGFRFAEFNNTNKATKDWISGL